MTSPIVLFTVILVVVGQVNGLAWTIVRKRKRAKTLALAGFSKPHRAWIPAMSSPSLKSRAIGVGIDRRAATLEGLEGARLHAA